MNTTTTATPTRPTWQPAMPLAARIALAAAVVAVLTPAWWTAQSASRDAVQSAGAAISRGPIHVLLPSVQVIGKRDPVVPARRNAV